MKSLEQQLHEAHLRINELEREQRERKSKRETDHHAKAVDLVECFTNLGLTEEEAELAAAPRLERPLLGFPIG